MEPLPMESLPKEPLPVDTLPVEPVGLVDVLARIDAEATALLDAALGAQFFFMLALLVVLAAAASAGARIAVHASRHRPAAERARIQIGIFAAAAVTGLALVVRTTYALAPLLVTVVLVLGVAGAFLGVAASVRGWLGGLLLLLTGRLRKGDRIGVGQSTGLVESLGLLRVVVESDGGGRLHVPLRTLVEQPLWVSSVERAHPVELVLTRATPFSVEERKRLHDEAALCPFRDPRNPVFVRSPPGQSNTVSIRLRAWSQPAAQRAEDYLRGRVCDVEDPPGTG